MLKPFREQMTEFRRRVDQIHTEESKTQAGLGEQLRQLQQLNMQMVEDARHLTNALKGQTKTQGNWGEMILERILEESGLTNGREYQTQVSVTTADGRPLRPSRVHARFRLDAGTRERGMRHVAEIRSRLAEASRPTTTGDGGDADIVHFPSPVRSGRQAS